MHCTSLLTALSGPWFQLSILSKLASVHELCALSIWCVVSPPVHVDWGEEMQKELYGDRMEQGTGYCVFKEERDGCGEELETT